MPEVRHLHDASKGGQEHVEVAELRLVRLLRRQPRHVLEQLLQLERLQNVPSTLPAL
jgi:hypothetical protein